MTFPSTVESIWDRFMTASTHATETLLFSVLLQLIVMIGVARLFNNLARSLGQPGVIGEIVAGDRAVTADTGLRLSRFFGMSEGFWIGLQADYDAARAKDSLRKTLARIRPWASRQAPAKSAA